MKALRHWMLHNDVLAQEFDEILKFSPGYNPIRNIDPAITFYASLIFNVSDIRGKIGNFSRASTATYRNSVGKLQEAASDISRHQWQGGAPTGVLMEPASTNKCTNWNANPDAALVNVDLGGPGSAQAVLQRVDDLTELRRFGIEQVCQQYAIELDNRAASDYSTITILGATGNQNIHSIACVARALVGEGRLQSSAGIGAITISGADYQAYKSEAFTPSNQFATLIIRAEIGAQIRFVLNQLEEQPVTTSAIVTKGVASSRAADVLNWTAGAPSIVHDAQGMAAILWRPGYDWSLIQDNQGEGIINTREVAASVLYSYKSSAPQGSLRSEHTPPGGPILNTSWTPDDVCLLVLRWSASANEHQISCKRNGTWEDSNINSYSGNFEQDGLVRLAFAHRFPTENSHCYLWNEDRGLAWLKEFFAQVAN